MYIKSIKKMTDVYGMVMIKKFVYILIIKIFYMKHRLFFVVFVCSIISDMSQNHKLFFWGGCFKQRSPCTFVSKTYICVMQSKGELK